MIHLHSMSIDNIPTHLDMPERRANTRRTASGGSFNRIKHDELGEVMMRLLDGCQKCI